MKHKLRRIIAATVALVGVSAAQAYVIQGVVTLDQLAPGNMPTADYDLHFGSRPASIFLSYANNQFNVVIQTVDANSLIVAAHPGDLVTAATLQNTSAWAPFYGNPSIGTDFYIAGMMQTGGGLSDPGEPSPPPGSPLVSRFGWAHIGLNPADTFTVLDSALTYGELGIIVGTTEAVPEPSSMALMLLGLGLAGVHVRRKTMP